MNEREHHELRMSLGAYVLGHLPPDERATVETHLEECASCRGELAELGPVADALDHVRRSGRSRGRPVEPPDDLGRRVLDHVSEAARHDRRRLLVRRGTVGGLAAAALLAVVAGTVAIVRPEPGPAVPLEAVPVRVLDQEVRASADLVNHTWGVEVRLTASGFHRGTPYRVAVIGTDGRRHSAGEFVGTGTRPMVCNLNSSVLRDRASGFEVADEEGHVLVSSSFG